MPFGLKNAGATYQRLVTKMFRNEIGKSMEVYVDDMLVKRKLGVDHVSDLDKTFQILRHYKMKLNAAKCAFGISSSKFLGFMVNNRGIEANPEKIQALLNIKPPKNLKEMQILAGMIASLNRFISKCSDKCRPLFKDLKKTKAFEWTEECDSALTDLKAYLGSPPLISIPRPNETIFVYLSSSSKAVSADQKR